MTDHKHKIPTIALAWLPAISIGFATIYLFWFSMGSGIPILSMMTPNDFISATLPFFLPTLIVSVFGLILALSTNLSAAKARETHPTTKSFRLKWKKVSYGVKWSLFVIPILLGSIFIFGFDLKSLLLLFLLIYNLILELFPNNKLLRLTFKAVDYYGYAGFLLPMILPALVLISVNGYVHGKTGRIALSPSKPLSIELNGGETISGLFSFCAGDFSLFYSTTNGTPIPILLKTDDISRMKILKKESNQSSEVVRQP